MDSSGLVRGLGDRLLEPADRLDDAEDGQADASADAGDRSCGRAEFTGRAGQRGSDGRKVHSGSLPSAASAPTRCALLQHPEEQTDKESCDRDLHHDDHELTAA